MDEESVKFIRWAFKYLKDEKNYKKLCDEIQKKVFVSYLNKDYLQKSLKKKLYKGAQEHGKPVYSEEALDEEIDNEITDLVGWSLLKIYNSKKI